MQQHPEDAEPQPRRAIPPEQGPPVPPVRPQLTPAPPPPVEPRRPPIPIIKAAKRVAAAGLASGLAAVIFAYFGASARIDALKTVAAAVAPGRDQATVSSVAVMTFWGAVGALAVILIAQVITLGILFERRRGARWWLLGILPLHVGAYLLADAFLATDDGGRVIGLLAGIHLALLAVTLVLVFLPAASGWFRRQPEAPKA